MHSIFPYLPLALRRPRSYHLRGKSHAFSFLPCQRLSFSIDLHAESAIGGAASVCRPACSAVTVAGIFSGGKCRIRRIPRLQAIARARNICPHQAMQTVAKCRVVHADFIGGRASMRYAPAESAPPVVFFRLPRA
eukprot:6196968-Pleurochrysis_carterae.AAC.3